MADDTPAIDDAAPSIADSLSSAIAGVVGRGRIVVTPYPFGVADNDFLRVTSANSAAGVTVEIHGRLARPGADAIPFRFVHVPNTDRTTKSQYFKLGGGLVTNLTVRATAGTPLVGQTFVIVQLVREQDGNAFEMGTLLAGPVTTTQPMGWPGSPIQNSLEAEPALREIRGTMPAVGGAITETCPAGARWELLSVFGQLITDATPGARAGLLSINSSQAFGFTALLFGNAAGDQPASTAYDWTWAQNLPAGFRTMFNVNPIPQRCLIRAGGGFTLFGQGAGDQWQAPVYTVLERLELS